MASRLVEKLDGFQRGRRWVGFPLAVVYKFADDQGSYLAALIAYYGFLSLFPLLLLLVTILGFVLQGDAELQEQLLDSALGQFPVIGSQLRDNVHSLTGNGAGLALGIALTLYGCLGVAGRGPERVQPRVGGAAQPAPEPDQGAAAQPVAAARPGRGDHRHDRARGADDERERLRRRRRRRAARGRDPARHGGQHRPVHGHLPRAHVEPGGHARPARRRGGGRRRLADRAGARAPTSSPTCCAGAARPTASSASCSA